MLVLSIGVFAGWDVWLQTRICKPIDIPIAITPGHVLTHEFKVNLSRHYTIEIEAKKHIPFDTLNCLLGMETMVKGCNQPSVVKANWALMSGGRMVAMGSSDTDQGGGWAQETIAREIGNFESQRGLPYVLDINFLEDGRALSATDPHLKVEVHPDFYEGTMFESYFLRWWCGASSILGVALLSVSGTRFLWRRYYIS